MRIYNIIVGKYTYNFALEKITFLRKSENMWEGHNYLNIEVGIYGREESFDFAYSDKAKNLEEGRALYASILENWSKV